MPRLNPEALTFGTFTSSYPPVEQVIQSAQALEAAGFDHVWSGDQLQFQHPHRLWTPELCDGARTQPEARREVRPAAADERPRPAHAAGVHRPGRARRDPARPGDPRAGVPHHAALHAGPRDLRARRRASGRTSARTATTTACATRGWSRPRGWCAPSSRRRSRSPTTAASGSSRDAVVELPPYDGVPPPLWLAGGGPKVLEAVGRWADGWLVYTPGGVIGRPERDRREARASRASTPSAPGATRGRSPARTLPLLLCHPDRDQVERWLDHPFMQWHALTGFPFGKAWREYGHVHPLGDGYSITLEGNMATMPLDRVLDLCRQVPRAMVENARLLGHARRRRAAHRRRGRGGRAALRALQLRRLPLRAPTRRPRPRRSSRSCAACARRFPALAERPVTLG